MEASLHPAAVGGHVLKPELGPELPLHDLEEPGWKHAPDQPCESFAQIWSLAERCLARLEQQLLVSDLRHSWICRADFVEAAALAAHDGETVAMEDLALVDAQSLPSHPSAGWVKARALLSLRRQISRVGPSKTLTAEGLLALERRATALLEGRGEIDEPLGDRKRAASEDRLRRWLAVVGELASTPALIATAVALRAWEQIKPLDRHGREIGLLLGPLLLWYWGKTKGMTVCLAAGLRKPQHQLNGAAPPDVWVRQFCEAVQVAADAGLETHDRIVSGRDRLAELLARHGAGPRLPCLAWLFLNYPVLSERFIERRLVLRGQGSNWLLQALIDEGVVEEISGPGIAPRPGHRAYSLTGGGS